MTDIERAREIVAQYYQNFRDHDYAGWVREGRKDRDPYVQFALAALAAAQSDMRELAWLIELPDGRYWGGVHGWTRDHLQAVRFVREIDAQRAAEGIGEADWDSYRLVEHEWCDLSPAALAKMEARTDD